MEGKHRRLKCIDVSLLFLATLFRGTRGFISDAPSDLEIVRICHEDQFDDQPSTRVRIVCCSMSWPELPEGVLIPWVVINCHYGEVSDERT